MGTSHIDVIKWNSTESSRKIFVPPPKCYSTVNQSYNLGIQSICGGNNFLLYREARSVDCEVLQVTVRRRVPVGLPREVYIGERRSASRQSACSGSRAERG